MKIARPRWPKLIVAGGISLAGYFEFGSSPAVAQSPGVSTNYARPYRGYYAYPSPTYAPLGAGNFTPSLHRGIMYSSSPFAQSPYTDDWSTARYLPYPKPWMGPR